MVAQIVERRPFGIINIFPNGLGVFIRLSASCARLPGAAGQAEADAAVSSRVQVQISGRA
jgi:hypothetical protein